MLDQAQVYQLFGEIDRLPGIMEPRVGRWRAWPMAKMQLVWNLMHAPSGAGAGESVSLLRKAARKLPPYVAAWPRIWQRPNGAVPSGAIGMLYAPRIHRFADGCARDFIFGELLTGAGLQRPIIALRHQLIPDTSPATPETIDLAPYHALAEQLALVRMADPRLRRTAAALNGRLDETDIPLARAIRARKVLLALALFEAKRRIFRRLFTQLGLSALVGSYAPGRYAEIAAARELGLPVMELQHGVIGSRCPDYAWPCELEPYKGEMPLPDRIVVFGPAFRDLVLRSGFWNPAEVVATGAAAMEAHRSSASDRARSPGPLRLLFMTQAPTRAAAIAFWRELAACPGFAARGYRVAFKIHQEEAENAEAYRSLAIGVPERFSLIAADANPIDVMLASDVVLSYNSMALIEALALGRAAVSICGGPIPQGFAGSFGLPEIVAAMPHVSSPAALLSVLTERAEGDGKLAQWQRESQLAGRDYFCDGFTANTADLINELVAQARHSHSNAGWARARPLPHPRGQIAHAPSPPFTSTAGDLPTLRRDSNDPSSVH
jgi:hypothetical protein